MENFLRVGISPTHIDASLLKDRIYTSTLEEIWGAEDAPLLILERPLSGSLFFTTALLHEAFNIKERPTGWGKSANHYVVEELKKRKIGLSSHQGHGKLPWTTAGCLMRLFFVPRQAALNWMKPLLHEQQIRYDDPLSDSNGGRIIAVHIRIGMLLASVRGYGSEQGTIAAFDNAANQNLHQSSDSSSFTHLDDAVLKIGGPKRPHSRQNFSRSLISDTFRCAEELSKAYKEKGQRVKFFVASDSISVVRTAMTHYHGQAFTTQSMAKHTSQAQGDEKYKVVVDWTLMASSANIVSLGSVQSTFSGSAWHYSLRPEMLWHVSDAGVCTIGGSGMYSLRGNYWHLDDPVLNSIGI